MEDKIKELENRNKELEDLQDYYIDKIKNLERENKFLKMMYRETYEVLSNTISLAERDYQDDVLIENIHLRAIMHLWNLYKREKEKIQKQDIEINKLKEENQRLKHSITKATEIIDEYADETEMDTKKLIEYQEKYLDN